MFDELGSRIIFGVELFGELSQKTLKEWAFLENVFEIFQENSQKVKNSKKLPSTKARTQKLNLD
jgi:hypothetical protein